MLIILPSSFGASATQAFVIFTTGRGCRIGMAFSPGGGPSANFRTRSFGLMESLKAQGKAGDARLVEERFKKAWRRADVTLSASRVARVKGR
jgi:hypothetical protein